MLKQLRYNLYFALLVTSATVLSEEIFFLLQYGQPLAGIAIMRFTFYAFMLGLVMSFIAQRWLVIATIVFFTSIQIIQAAHIDYFGAPITPDMIGHFFHDPLEDTTEILQSVQLSNFLAPLLMLLTVFAAWQLEKCAYRRTVRFRYGFLLLSGLAIFPYQIANAVKPHKYYPQPAETLMSNFINAWSLHALREEFSGNRAAYQPYTLTPVSSGVRNIVLIIGESCNPQYMGLFGYKEDTTPLLSALLKEEGDHMHAGEIYSTSVSTFPSISLLMNVIREPGNLGAIERKEHNLMHLAKLAGFTTAWIGNQSANNLVYAGLEKADFMHTSQATSLFRLKGFDDDVLLATLKDYELNADRHFIVIHQRNLHSPYESNYRNHPELQLYSDAEITAAMDRESHARKTYINAMRYNDYTLASLFRYLKEQLKDKGESYIIYTSDHGELLGKMGSSATACLICAWRECRSSYWG